MEQTFILNFLTQYKLWILAGAPEQNPYDLTTKYALCENLRRYTQCVFREIIHDEDEADDIAHEAKYALMVIFDNEGLDVDYPFGMRTFMVDSDTRTHHLNEKRLEWIRLKLELPYNQPTTEV